MTEIQILLDFLLFQCMKVSKFGCVQILMNKKLSEIEMTFCNANNFRSQPEFREISLVERCLASRRIEVSGGLNVPSKFQNFIWDIFCELYYHAGHPF